MWFSWLTHVGYIFPQRPWLNFTHRFKKNHVVYIQHGTLLDVGSLFHTVWNHAVSWNLSWILLLETPKNDLRKLILLIVSTIFRVSEICLETLTHGQVQTQMSYVDSTWVPVDVLDPREIHMDPCGKHSNPLTNMWNIYRWEMFHVEKCNRRKMHFMW